MTTFMRCGHVANAVVDDRPVCSLCLGSNLYAVMPDENPPALIGRTAMCKCGVSAPSSTRLTGFCYRGAGSKDAAVNCMTCGKRLVLHLDRTAGHTFLPHGPYDADVYDCGCSA